MKTKAVTRKTADYIAAAGVIVSIVFVGFELRQNTAAVRGATYQDLASTSAALTMLLAGDEEFASLFERWITQPAPLNAVEKIRIYAYLLGIGRNMENAFQQHRVGTLTDDLWVGYLATWRSIAASPGFADYWSSYSARFSSAFREYVDTAVISH